MQGIKLRDSFLGSSTLFSLELCAYFETWILSKRYKWLHDTSDCMIDVIGCADKAPLDRNRKRGTGRTKDKQSVWGCYCRHCSPFHFFVCVPCCFWCQAAKNASRPGTERRAREREKKAAEARQQRDAARSASASASPSGKGRRRRSSARPAASPESSESGEVRVMSDAMLFEYRKVLWVFVC